MCSFRFKNSINLNGMRMIKSFTLNSNIFDRAEDHSKKVIEKDNIGIELVSPSEETIVMLKKFARSFMVVDMNDKTKLSFPLA